MSNEPDQRTILGYSIASPEKRSEWAAFIGEIAEILEQHDAAREIVFHGTSEVRASVIMRYGMKPTDLQVASPSGEIADGSFWGCPFTASAYADDTVKERDGGGSPALIAVRTSDLLANGYDLYPDLASLEFPLKGLTRLDDSTVSDKWQEGHETLSWKDSLDDLGAITVAHDDWMSPEHFAMVRSPEDLRQLLGVGPAIRR